MDPSVQVAKMSIKFSGLGGYALPDVQDIPLGSVRLETPRYGGIVFSSFFTALWAGCLLVTSHSHRRGDAHPTIHHKDRPRDVIRCR